MRGKPKVLVTGNTNPLWLSELSDLAQIEIWNAKDSFLMPRSAVLARIKDIDAIINFAELVADEEFVLNAKKLKIIANVSIGYDNLDLQLLNINKKWATNAPGFFNYPVAEYVLAGILVLQRRLLEADDFVRKNEWKSFEPGRWDGISLKDQTLGIVGFGSIGHELRKLAQSLGTKVVYFDPIRNQEEGALSFEDLIAVSDIVSVHIPLNISTKNLFSDDVISKMKNGAILVNTSRGTIVDQNALITALQSGKLSGAVLDVFTDEPNVPNSLKQMKNVLITPHMAGGTISAREACVRCATGNVAEVLKGNIPPNALNDPLLC